MPQLNLSGSESSDESICSCTNAPNCPCTTHRLKGVKAPVPDRKISVGSNESSVSNQRLLPPLLTVKTGESSSKLSGIPESSQPSDGEHGSDEEPGKSTLSIPQRVRRSSTVALNSKEIKSLSVALGSEKHEIATIRDSRTGRRFSAMIDSTTGNPISFLGTKDGKRLSLHPITRSSIAELFDYHVPPSTSVDRRASEIPHPKKPSTPWLGVQPLSDMSPTHKSTRSLLSLPSISLPKMSIGPLKMPRRQTRTDYKALKQKGDEVRMSDYRVINRSFAYVIIIIVISIITFAALSNTVEVWVYFVVLGISISLTIISICYLKLHFYQKAKRFQRQYIRHRRATIFSQSQGRQNRTVFETGNREQALLNISICPPRQTNLAVPAEDTV